MILLGSNPALYGELSYILSYVTAGELIQFFALPLNNQLKSIEITKRFDLRFDNDKKEFLICLFNIFRWIKTIFTLGFINIIFLFYKINKFYLEFLPDKIYAPKDEIYHNSPHFKDSTTIITFHHDFIEKKFEIPSNFFPIFYSIYSLLLDNKIRNTIKPIKISINDYLNFSKITKNTILGEKISINLQLQPVGAIRTPCNENQLKDAIICVLEFLEDFHKFELVHRDLRWPNILSIGNNKWIVIDMELADENGKNVFWKNDVLKEEVYSNKRGYEYKDDLYQVSLLFESFFFLKNEMKIFSDDLKLGKFKNATDALKVLSSIKIN